jgi:hypothetical protein
VSLLALTPQTQDLHGLDSHTTPNPHGFTQNPWPIHGFTKKLDRKRSREGERERGEKPRERVAAEVGGGAGGACFWWKNKDLGHGGLGPIQVRKPWGRVRLKRKKREKWRRRKVGGGWRKNEKERDGSGLLPKYQPKRGGDLGWGKLFRFKCGIKNYFQLAKTNLRTQFNCNKIW